MGALLSFLLASHLVAQETTGGTLTAAEAAAHVGERATVCGTVASATFAARSRGRPTFLNLDRAYPDHIFTVVIWGDNRSRFAEPPEAAFRNRRICITGTVAEYRGNPQIIVRSPDQIRVLAEETNRE